MNDVMNWDNIESYTLDDLYCSTIQVFTWYGATIEIDGITGNEYISCEVSFWFHSLLVQII